MGQYKPRDNAEFETDLKQYYIKLIAGGIEVLEIDVLKQHLARKRDGYVNKLSGKYWGLRSVI